MLSLEEAQARLLAATSPLPAEGVPLAQAIGRVLAADIVARRTQPPFAASAMDGYAIRHADLPGPWQLIGEAVAGRRFDGMVGLGECVRILTGAPLPAGADTVVVQEDVAASANVVRLIGDGPPFQGAHVRPAGLDFAAGAMLAVTGTKVTPTTIGLCAAGGYASLPVHRRPRVLLLSTGDELVPPGDDPGPDHIVDANTPMLAALLGRHAEIVHSGIVPDDAEAIAQALDQAIDADVLVTIGGASVGDRDLVLPALRAKGAVIDFWKVAIRPGKPMLTGTLGATRVLGLPGNPVSAFVCAQLFLLPLLRRLGGDPSPLPVLLRARIALPIAANGMRRDHLRARLDHETLVVRAAEIQDSAMLRVLAESNALIVRRPHAPPAAAGEWVDVLPLDSD